MNKNTLLVKQMMDQQLVDSLTLDVPTGSHDHQVDGGGATTTHGGVHRHVFRTEAGDLLITDISGAHEHTLYPASPYTGSEAGDADELYTNSCGEHVHTITLADGTVLKTEIDGWHSHLLDTKPEQSEAGEAADPQGQHRHRLVLPNGVVLMSLWPGDDLDVLAREAGNAAYRVNATKGYPQSPTSVGKAEVIVKDNKAGVRLTLGFDDSKYVVDFDVARKGVEVDSTDEALVGFGLTGYRCMTPILGATTKARVSKRCTRVDAATEVDTLKVTWGLQSDIVKEAFLSGEHFTGVLVLRKGSDGWTASFERVATPLVLTKGAPLPPRGFSALPVSLAKNTPPRLSFWTTSAPELAKSQRDTLMVSRYFSAENLAMVSGELRKVERKTTVRLYEPKLEKAELRTYADEVSRLLPEKSRPMVAKGREWEAVACPIDGVLVIDAKTVDDLADLGKCEDRYLVIAPDSVETRARMAQFGQVFKLEHPDAAGRVLVASYDLTLAKDASAAYSLPITSTLEVKVLAVNVDKALAAADDFGNRTLLHKADDGSVNEERYTLGIVLEPDVIDSQNDTYDAPTIRKAAHLYMERYQTMGLQHKEMTTDIQVVESYLAPVDMTINGRTIKAGTWLMGNKYAEGVWKDVLAGKYTGLSIGGYANRQPATKAAAPAEVPAEVPAATPAEEAPIDTTGNAQ